MAMHLSRNELKSLLTRVFEALYGHKRDYHDMAHLVLWLECHGHKGVEALVKALPVLDKMGLPHPKISQGNDGHYIIDAGGHNLFCLARSICDLAQASLGTGTPVRVDIANSDTMDGLALIGVLHCPSQAGYAAMVAYKDRLARIDKHANFPVIYSGPSSKEIRLICAYNSADLNTYTQEYTQILTDQNAQKIAYQTCIAQGIDIDDRHYQMLNAIADRVLVEATEASRKGAGE